MHMHCLPIPFPVCVCPAATCCTNCPVLLLGDVVYVRLASALTPLARQALAAELTKQLEAVQKRYKQVQANAVRRADCATVVFAAFHEEDLPD